MMSTPMEAWAAAWSAHDVERLASLFTEDGAYEDVTFGVVNAGKDGVRAWATGFLASFPDLNVTANRWFRTGDVAALEWSMSGTHQGEFAGWAPTGARFEVRGVTMFELREDHIVNCADYWDMATVRRHLGVAPPSDPVRNPGIQRTI